MRKLWNGCGEVSQVYFARTVVQNYTPEGKPAAKGNICRGKQAPWDALGPTHSQRKTLQRANITAPSQGAASEEPRSSALSSKHRVCRRSQPQPSILLSGLQEQI